MNKLPSIVFKWTICVLVSVVLALPSNVYADDVTDYIKEALQYYKTDSIPMRLTASTMRNN